MVGFETLKMSDILPLHAPTKNLQHFLKCLKQIVTLFWSNSLRGRSMNTNKLANQNQNHMRQNTKALVFEAK
jgi:hypothetical protein